MGWKDWENIFVNLDDEQKIMAYAYRKRGVLFLKATSIKPSMAYEKKAPLIVVTAYSFATISLEVAYCRLGHVGQPTAKINYHKIGEEVYGDEYFNCEACKIAKSKRIVSHINQTRSEIPWEFIHIDI